MRMYFDVATDKTRKVILVCLGGRLQALSLQCWFYQIWMHCLRKSESHNVRPGT